MISALMLGRMQWKLTFVLENPLLGFLASKVKWPIQKHLYENYEELSGCFVAGAPGFLTETSILVLAYQMGPQLFTTLLLSIPTNLMLKKSEIEFKVSH